MCVGSLKSKNLALLCKWLWRFRNEESTLWVQIIKAIYGPDGGINSQWHFSTEGSWLGVLRAGHDVSRLIPDLEASFERVVGGGRNIRFWLNSWIDGKPLVDQFKRLFKLDLHQDTTLADRVRWKDGALEWHWSWRHVPRGREVGELAEFLLILQSADLSSNKEDGWI